MTALERPSPNPNDTTNYCIAVPLKAVIADKSEIKEEDIIVLTIRIIRMYIPFMRMRYFL